MPPLAQGHEAGHFAASASAIAFAALNFITRLAGT